MHDRTSPKNLETVFSEPLTSRACKEANAATPPSGVMGRGRAKTAKIEPSKGTQRRAVEREAIALLDAAMSLPAKQRTRAVARIRKAKNPLKEAGRIVGNRLGDTADLWSSPEWVDHSDVQELFIKLTRRDGVVDPIHCRMLAGLDRRIAEAKLTRTEFNNIAAQILAIPSAWPKEARAAEAAYLRGEDLETSQLTQTGVICGQQYEPMGEVVTVHFDGEAPNIGSGRRRVEVVSEGRKVHLRAVANPKLEDRISPTAWEAIRP